MISDLEGFIDGFDRNYGGFYDHDIVCMWTVMSGNGSFIQLKFLEMNIPICKETGTCASDYLQVADI